MKNSLLALMFLTQMSYGARILDAQWNAQNNSVVVRLAYQGGCKAHHFYVDWLSCTTEINQTPLVWHHANILDTGASDTCTEELEQTVTFQEPIDGCLSDVIVLKSTSSKVPYIISK